jgi:hypothetical protein
VRGVQEVISIYSMFDSGGTRVLCARARAAKV